MAEDDRSASILATSWTLTGLAGLFLGARLLCKLKTKRHLWWDDHVLVLSWVMLLASVIMVTLEVSKGLGKHADRVPSGNIERMRFFGNFTGSFSILAAVWSKTSFAVTLLRLMSARMRIALWAVIASINIFMGLNVVFMWARCRPVSMIWSPSPTGTCWPRQVYPSYAMFAAGYSGAVDFLLALLPWKIIWNLRMKPKEKIAVAVAMSMGVLSVARFQPLDCSQQMATNHRLQRRRYSHCQNGAGADHRRSQFYLCYGTTRYLGLRRVGRHRHRGLDPRPAPAVPRCPGADADEEAIPPVGHRRKRRRRRRRRRIRARYGRCAVRGLEPDEAVVRSGPRRAGNNGRERQRSAAGVWQDSAEERVQRHGGVLQ